MSLRAITYLAAAGLAAFLAWQFQGARLGAEIAQANADAIAYKLQVSTEKHAAEMRVRRVEQSMNLKYQGAMNDATKRETTLRRELDSLHSVSNSLREQSATAAKRLANAPEASVVEYASAIGVVFDDCRAEYADMAGKAQGHANDARLMRDAWTSYER